MAPRPTSSCSSTPRRGCARYRPARRPAARPQLQAPISDLERELRLGLVASRVLLILRWAEARGEQLKSKKRLMLRYTEATGRVTNIGHINSALRELSGAGFVDGLRLAAPKKANETNW